MTEKEAMSTPSSPPNGRANPDTAELARHTLTRRPWRRAVTPFEDIVSYAYMGKGTKEAPFLVEWLPNDVENPQRFGAVYRWFCTFCVSVATVAVALASSAFTGEVESLMRRFHASDEVITLGLSMFVLGFAFGPLLWAPLSEVLGRRTLFIFTYAMLTLWNAVTCASNNIGALIVFRFLAGAFGSSPLTNSGGTIADIFPPASRGVAMAVFAVCPFLGPSIGPLIGGFIGMAGGWRWVQGFLAIFSGVITIFGWVALPETYAPVLLRARARKLSEVTGQVYIAKLDEGKNISLQHLFKVSLSRPWALLFKEPIVLLLSLYMAVIYGTLYLLFAAFPIVFQVGRGWNPGVGGLAFLGVLVGMLICVLYVIFVDDRRYRNVMRKHGGIAPPEARLHSAMLGGPLVVIGLAWFSATCAPNVFWLVSIMAGAPFGGGMVLVFLSTMNYLIDAYSVYAASVLAANSVIRSIFGAVFPLFTSYMYRNLGVHWASAIPGFLALACLPFPVLFYKYGQAIRQKCQYASEAEAMFKALMERHDPAAGGEEGGQLEREDEDIEGQIGISDQDELALHRSRTRQERMSVEKGAQGVGQPKT